jgi:hypothetical protein
LTGLNLLARTAEINFAFQGRSSRFRNHMQTYMISIVPLQQLPDVMDSDAQRLS